MGTFLLRSSAIFSIMSFRSVVDVSHGTGDV